MIEELQDLSMIICKLVPMEVLFLVVDQWGKHKLVFWKCASFDLVKNVCKFFMLLRKFLFWDIVKGNRRLTITANKTIISCHPSLHALALK